MAGKIGCKMREFVLRPSWGTSDVFASIGAVFAIVWYFSPWIYPASDWIELHSITVSDAAVDEEIQMKVDRTLYKGTDYGRYVVQIRNHPENTTVCTAKRNVPYDETSVLDKEKPLSLKWWAYSEDGECVKWRHSPGRYYVTTKHCWHGKWWARETCNKITKSNIFTVYVKK